MAMKNEKTKIKEPYSPENTPNPPQIIDPSQKNERNENEQPIENKQGTGNSPKSTEQDENTKPKRFAETEPD